MKLLSRMDVSLFCNIFIVFIGIGMVAVPKGLLASALSKTFIKK